MRTSMNNSHNAEMVCEKSDNFVNSSTTGDRVAIYEALTSWLISIRAVADKFGMIVASLPIEQTKVGIPTPNRLTPLKSGAGKVG